MDATAKRFDSVLVMLLLVLTAIEFSHRTMPVITRKASDHLVVIGDSISSGIDPRVPAMMPPLRAPS
jgi:hypothetical protein